MPETTATEPLEPRRVKAFARFFKNYMSVSTIVTAALPIPVTALGAIPTFKSQTAMFATYSSLFCFLLLAFIFYMRHGLARWMFVGFVAKREKPTLRMPWPAGLRLQ